MAVRDYDRLLKAVRWSRKAMEPFRRQRQKMVRAMYGAHWMDGSFGSSQPVNMLELTVRIWLRNLVAKAPTVTVTAKDRKYRPVAKDFELVMRQVISEIELAKALEDAAFDALTCPVGMVKVGITERKLAEQAGFTHDAGLPFVDPVDFDDMVLDMASARFEAMHFVGDRYSLPFEAMMDSKLFRRRDDVRPTSQPIVHDEFGNRNTDELATIGASDTDERNAEPMIELWDVWKPRDSVVCTFVAGVDGLPKGDPIRTVEWDGPEMGPYIALSYGKGKGLLKLPPVAALKDLHDTINRNFRKLDRQSGRQKTITAVQSGAEQDGERVVNASDGETIRVDRTDSIREMRFGGADPTNLAFSLQLKDIFSYIAGNLDSQGGLSQTASTLGQEEMIRESSSQTTEDMRTTTVQFAKRVLHSVAAWVWYDPVREYLVEKPLGNSGITIPVSFTPKDREETNVMDMMIDVMPSSMVDTSNGQKLRTLQGALDRTVLPLMPAIQANGLRVDVQAILNTMAILTDTPELGEMVVSAPIADPNGLSGQPSGQPSGQSDGEKAPKPPVTRREYIRKSVPSGGTRSARDGVMSQTLMGANVTPQQQQMMSR